MGLSSKGAVDVLRDVELNGGRTGEYESSREREWPLFPELLTQRRWDKLIERFQLTRREAEVARSLTRGGQLQDIADHLGVELETLRKHARSVYHKTGCRDRLELVLTLVHGGRQDTDSPAS